MIQTVHGGLAVVHGSRVRLVARRPGEGRVEAIRSGQPNPFDPIKASEIWAQKTPKRAGLGVL